MMVSTGSAYPFARSGCAESGSCRLPVGAGCRFLLTALAAAAARHHVCALRGTALTDLIRNKEESDCDPITFAYRLF